ncbi:DinB family protein [Mucilaginibacter pedocola]|uniref:DinB-like domain-containing protein n=1 Tax=Mucilaginibacter pedocola TaxID=1792845 RepID=A0A1S9PJ52_9SPHI|nr:DinB family protein [Mucilaginibacter pedocola]OOQ60608.1 hypothetical protein BC343_23715 [Mucilaginibacter pedocola]
MASIPDTLNASLQSILSGDPWYGPNTYSIIDSITFEDAYEMPPGAVHSIAGILLHMLGWAQEVTQRMQGQPAGEPAAGDWPNPGNPDEDKWQQLKDNFKLANVTLQSVINSLPADKWDAPTNDTRDPAMGTGVTYRQLIEGLIQHHIYHSGQLALMNRLLS